MIIILNDALFVTYKLISTQDKTMNNIYSHNVSHIGISGSGLEKAIGFYTEVMA